MKILFISNFLDGTGWSHAGIDYALALDAAGADVVCRTIRLNNHEGAVPERLRELLAKSSHDCEVVVQHALPHLMQYDGHFKKNIGLFVSETSNFRATAWPSRLNEMDEVWVANRQMVEACRSSWVDRPIHVVPHATNVAKFSRRYAPVERLAALGDTFKFYFIGEFTRRKNLAALVRAFHSEFEPTEAVDLVIKTSVLNQPAATAAEIVKRFCDEIKPGLKKFGGDASNFRQEIIIADRLTEESMYRLHNSCDCFVCPSYGEAWCIPAFDAMGFGKTPIVTAWGGFLDYTDDSVGWAVPARDEPAFGVADTFQDLYTGDENWGSIDIRGLQAAMRQAFEDEELRKDKAAAGIDRAFDFSHEAIGLKMLRALDHEQTVQESALGTPT